MMRSRLAATFCLGATLADPAARADGDDWAFARSERADGAGRGARIVVVDPSSKPRSADVPATCRSLCREGRPSQAGPPGHARGRFGDARRRWMRVFSPLRGPHPRANAGGGPIVTNEPPVEPAPADSAHDGPVESIHGPCLGCGRVVRPAPVKVWVRPASEPATLEVEH